MCALSICAMTGGDGVRRGAVERTAGGYEMMRGVRFPMLGEHNVQNCLAAIAVALEMGSFPTASHPLSTVWRCWTPVRDKGVAAALP